jgi:molybdopterin converting factor small subunit
MLNKARLSLPVVTVTLPGALTRLFPGADAQVEVAAGTVDEMLDALDACWPGMADRLRDSRPAVRQHISVFVDGERASLGTPLRPGTTIHVLTAMSGG